MPGFQLSFSEDNVKKRPFDFPKLKLANGETARLTIVESPYSEYVHSIQKPVLDESNRLIMQTKERKDGTEYQVPKLTFVSNPICLGDREVLEKEGIDPDNCIVCARAKDDFRLYAPKRRFAMHVIRTNTVPGKFDPNGTGQQLLIWAFTDQIFNKIVEINNDFPLNAHDLKLGPCTDANFQKADLAAAKDTAVTPEIRDALFVEKNKSEDPTVFCGQRKSEARIQDDLNSVDAVYALAKGEEGSDISVRDLSQGISSILEESAGDGLPTVSAEASVPATSVEDIAPSAPAPEEKKPSAGGSSLDDLFDNL